MMKRFFLGLALVTMTASAAAAGGMSFDLPRLDFPGTGAEVTQTCNLLTQTCSQ
ncbi:hypothetical protein U717_00450 [Rhodobacter capsulatus R121]|jgi:type 1 fimbria pilin|nr:hypothetical protein [Rhodobacter capsulatus]ETD03627.1 hypothetical protein U714_00450 [Rhodobacter capsulatus DE442]ETD80419.1 hypothetical protein U717_00450 [Rhodobacter capsulatus R121]ETE55685.1 hypothetical protein U715_00450 [Rhodobacter capsulatus Y262]